MMAIIHLHNYDSSLYPQNSEWQGTSPLRRFRGNLDLIVVEFYSMANQKQAISCPSTDSVLGRKAATDHRASFMYLGYNQSHSKWGEILLKTAIFNYWNCDNNIKSSQFKFYIITQA